MSTKIKIIAEIGINHNGSFEVAKKLIQASKNANLNAVKFQYRNLETSYSDYADREIGDEILISQIKENFLSPEKLLELASFAHDLNLGVGISVFDSGDIYDFGDGLKSFDFFKLPSAELTNYELIDSFIKTKKHLYISTGAHSEFEIERALERLPKIGWTPLHCVSNYPLKAENAKLGYIKFLQKKWNKEVGYSSHDENWEICLLAIANGAKIIERHITLDKKDKGLDHSSSSTPEEFNKLSEIAKNYDFLNLGKNQRSPNQGERLNRQNLGRSYFFAKDVKSGQKLSQDHIEYRTPFKGIGKCEVNQFIGKPILKDVNRGVSLSQSLFLPEEKLSTDTIDFAKTKNISIPVRFHDYDLISRVLPIEAFELHLSYEEALSIKNINKLDKNNKYSIHLPDYINDSELIDPFSQKDSQKELSFNIINKVVNLAEKLQNKTGTIVPIVGSFSVIEKSKLEFYEKIAELITGFKSSDVHILPQWLPPVAWYFGGSVSLNAFCSEEDVFFVDNLQIPICMDFCHLFMGASYFNFKAEDVLKKLKPLTKHVHLSEASGFDGEGMQFGEGDAGQTKIIGDYLSMDCMKVIEVWQGHLDQGAGFRQAIERLQKFYG